MKKLVITLIIALSVCPVLYAQTTVIFGAIGGPAIPVDTFSDSHSTGYDVGALVKIESGDSCVYTVLGLDYLAFSGKTISVEGVHIKYKPVDFTSFYFGPQIGKSVGPYFLPALTVSVSEGGFRFRRGDYRFGYDVGAGYVRSLGMGKLKAEAGAKYSFVNVLEKEPGETSRKIIRIFLGVSY